MVCGRDQSVTSSIALRPTSHGQCLELVAPIGLPFWGRGESIGLCHSETLFLSVPFTLLEIPT